MTDLETLKAELCCLIPNPGVEMPSCHEYHACDCTVLKLIERIERMTEALEFYASLKVVDCVDEDTARSKLNECAQLLLSMDNGRKAREALEEGDGDGSL